MNPDNKCDRVRRLLILHSIGVGLITILSFFYLVVILFWLKYCEHQGWISSYCVDEGFHRYFVLFRNHVLSLENWFLLKLGFIASAVVMLIVSLRVFSYCFFKFFDKKYPAK